MAAAKSVGLTVTDEPASWLPGLLDQRSDARVARFFACWPQFLRAALATQTTPQPAPATERSVAADLLARWLKQWPAAPPSAGRGIVTCGGGSYALSVWVLVSLLRRLGCSLPVECFCLGDEFDPQWVLAMRSLDCRVIDAEAAGFRPLHCTPPVTFLGHTYPPKQLAGFMLKSWAILHCSFERVLWLDADNCPARDPSFLLGDVLDQAGGAILWPDLPDSHLTPNWAALNIPPGGGEGAQICAPSFAPCESGQMAFDRSRHYRELWLANQINAYAEEFYKHIYGDKDSFPAAFALCGTPFTRIAHAPTRDWPAIVQHGPDNEPLFWHRAGPEGKWRIPEMTKTTAAAARVVGLSRERLSQATDPRERQFLEDAYAVSLAYQNEHATNGNPAPVMFPNNQWAAESLAEYSQAMRGPGLSKPITRATLEAASTAAGFAVQIDQHTDLCRVLAGPAMFCDRRDEHIGVYLRRDGFWEAWITVYLLQRLQPGMRCVDVGAHCGYYTAVCQMAGAGQVLAVEPQAHHAELLRRSIAANGWKSVEVWGGCCGTGPGTIEIQWSFDNPAASTIPLIAPPDGTRCKVGCDSLDNLTKDWPSVDFVKIDAEGAEASIWAGMRRLRKGRTMILMEVRTSRLEKPREFLQEVAAEYALREVNFDSVLADVSIEQMLQERDRDFLLWLEKD